MSDIVSLPATELLHRYRDCSLSPAEYFAELERHIASWEPSIHALYAYDIEGAKTQAKASSERWAKGAPIGPLDGVPVTLKELIATKGVPVPQGTAATVLTPASEDAPTAARLKEAGAIVFAKTTCPDYGMLSSGLSTFHPLTRNPWDLSKNPGGSSAGAAAAAAAGYGPLHIGTDIGGSVRLPAGWCGIFGFKPTIGRIPIDPYYVGRCAGPMTRTVEDAALAMQVVSRPDWRDGTSLPPQDIDWSDLAIDVRGARIGVMLDAGCGLPADDEVKAAVVAAARHFAAAGAKVVEVKGVLTRAMLDGLDDFWRAKFWGEIERLDEDTRSRILPYIFTWAKRGAQVTGVEAAQGFNQTVEMNKACGALFRDVDFVLSPTNPIVNYPAEWASPTNSPEKPFEHIAFTVPWNMSGQPASSINCGFSATGFPIGLQIVGPRFADLEVLQLSRLFEGWMEPTAWPRAPRQ
jgi:aspartyl-tRNA(Asn)/glutamyl-tRNA(Gln) amidotransferase subunit A